MSKNFLQAFRLYKDIKKKRTQPERVFLAWNRITGEYEICFFSVTFAKTFLPNLELITTKTI